jgi:hypothetical protein
MYSVYQCKRREDTVFNIIPRAIYTKYTSVNLNLPPLVLPLTRLPSLSTCFSHTSTILYILYTMPSVNFLPFLQGIPFATRIITLSLISASLVAISLSYIAGQNIDGGIPSVNLPWLVMVPGSSYWYPWTLLTAGWVELSVIGVSYSFLMVDRMLTSSWQSLPSPYPWHAGTWNEYGDGRNSSDSALLSSSDLMSLHSDSAG